MPLPLLFWFSPLINTCEGNLIKFLLPPPPEWSINYEMAPTVVRLTPGGARGHVFVTALMGVVRDGEKQRRLICISLLRWWVSFSGGSLERTLFCWLKFLDTFSNSSNVSSNSCNHSIHMCFTSFDTLTPTDIPGANSKCHEQWMFTSLHEDCPIFRIIPHSFTWWIYICSILTMLTRKWERFCLIIRTVQNF